MPIRANSRSAETWIPQDIPAIAAAEANAAKAKNHERRAQNEGVVWQAHQWVFVRRHLADEQGFFARLLSKRETKHYEQQFTVYLPVALHGDCETTLMVDQELIRPVKPQDFLIGRHSRRKTMRQPQAQTRFLLDQYRCLLCFKDRRTPVSQPEMDKACLPRIAREPITELHEDGHIDPDVTPVGTIRKGWFTITQRGQDFRDDLAKQFGKSEAQRKAQSGPSPLHNNGKSPAIPGNGANLSQGTTPDNPSDTSGLSSAKVTRTTTRRARTKTDGAGLNTPTSKAGHKPKSTRGKRKRPKLTTSPSAALASADLTHNNGDSDTHNDSNEARESRDSD